MAGTRKVNDLSVDQISSRLYAAFTAVQHAHYAIWGQQEEYEEAVIVAALKLFYVHSGLFLVAQNIQPETFYEVIAPKIREAMIAAHGAALKEKIRQEIELSKQHALLCGFPITEEENGD